MNKVVLALIFGILLIAAYVAGFTIGASAAWAFGFENLATSLFGAFTGAAWAGEFISSSIIGE